VFKKKTDFFKRAISCLHADRVCILESTSDDQQGESGQFSFPSWIEVFPMKTNLNFYLDLSVKGVTANLSFPKIVSGSPHSKCCSTYSWSCHGESHYKKGHRYLLSSCFKNTIYPGEKEK
jgi:hypothetical protein